MRLAALFESRVIREYQLDRVDYDVVRDAANDDPRAMVVVYDPATGESATGYEHNTSHSNLLHRLQELYQKSNNPTVRAAATRLFGGAARAYWVPSTGDLFVYQMEPPNRLASMVIDPPDDVISKMIERLNVADRLSRVAIIE